MWLCIDVFFEGILFSSYSICCNCIYQQLSIKAVSFHSPQHPPWLASTLFFRLWPCTNYWVMFATITEPFFSLFPWRRAWHARAFKGETNPYHFHCTKMCSLSSTAILPQADKTLLETSPSNALLFSQLVFLQQSRNLKHTQYLWTLCGFGWKVKSHC